MTQASANPEELSKFKAVANDWWDPSGPMKPLHPMNQARTTYIQQQTEVAGKQWLDIGCGGGLLCESLAKLGAEITGIDPCAELIDVAQQHAQQQSLNINYHVRELHQHPQQTSYDCISCMELLEHVDEPEALLQLCKPLLKPGGTLYLSTLNRNWKSFALGIVAAEYVLRLVPRGTHRYQQFIKPSELQRWLQNSGFELADIRGMHYDPIANSCELNDDVSVNYIIKATRVDSND